MVNEMVCNTCFKLHVQSDFILNSMYFTIKSDLYITDESCTIKPEAMHYEESTGSLLGADYCTVMHKVG